jgi:hypothetical protein
MTDTDEAQDPRVGIVRIKIVPPDLVGEVSTHSHGGADTCGVVCNTTIVDPFHQ